MNSYILLILLPLCYAFHPFINKKVIEKMSILEYYYISYLIPFVLLSFYIFYYSEKNLTFYQRFTYDDYKILILMISISIIANLIYLNLLNRKNVTDIIPITDPLKLMFILMISQTIFGEKLAKTQIYGILIIAIGMLVFNCESILKSSQIKTTT